MELFLIISNLGQWFNRRCCLKLFLSLVQVAILFSGVEPLEHFLFEGLCVIVFLPVVEDEISLKEKAYRQHTIGAGQRQLTKDCMLR